MTGSANRERPGFVRIIGGEWRGRRLPVVDQPGLRPSGDRARETLFNWLQPRLRGAVCADLFAGTGVLGLEAFSRGAAEVTLIENTPVAVRSLRAAVEKLQGPNGRPGLSVVESDALAWLQRRESRSLDVVFIDPPFGTGLDARALSVMGERDLVRAGGLVYLETARAAPPVPIGPGWDAARGKTVGEVRMLLLQKI